MVEFTLTCYDRNGEGTNSNIFKLVSGGVEDGCRGSSRERRARNVGRGRRKSAVIRCCGDRPGDGGAGDAQLDCLNDVGRTVDEDRW